MPPDLWFWLFRLRAELPPHTAVGEVDGAPRRCCLRGHPDCGYCPVWGMPVQGCVSGGERDHWVCEVGHAA